MPAAKPAPALTDADLRTRDRSLFLRDLRVLIRWAVPLCTAEVEEDAHRRLRAVLLDPRDAAEHDLIRGEYARLVAGYAGANGKGTRLLVGKLHAAKSRYGVFRAEAVRLLEREPSVLAHRAALERAAEGLRGGGGDGFPAVRAVIERHLRGRYHENDGDPVLLAEEYASGRVRPLTKGVGLDDFWRRVERLLFVALIGGVVANLHDDLLAVLKRRFPGRPAADLDEAAWELTAEFRDRQLKDERYLQYDRDLADLSTWAAGRAERFVKDIERRPKEELPASGGSQVAPAAAENAPACDESHENAEWVADTLASVPLRQREGLFLDLMAARVPGTKRDLAPAFGRSVNALAQSSGTAKRNLRGGGDAR